MNDYRTADCPEIHYREQDDGLVLTGCYGVDGRIMLPDEIGGRPITAIAPYAFSEKEEAADDMVWLGPYVSLHRERKRLCTKDVLEIQLPAGVKEIGKYAFYRCRNLKRMIMSNSLLDIGGGAFTGCRLSQVEIHFYQGQKSALKSIVDEIRFEITAKLYYHELGQTARVLFPEHYEEAVENTPARILETHHHGAGGYYRQCFYERELDYKKYDELLVRAIAEEEEETVVRLALLRLRYPLRLSGKAKAVYETYLNRHLRKAAIMLVNDEDIKGLRFMSDNRYWNAEALDCAVKEAGRLKKTEILSMMMDMKHEHFPKSKKSFEL